MTLFLGRIRDGSIELGSDGLSISTRLANQPGRTTLQKLFPAPDRPLAIAQVGANILVRDGRERSFASVVGEFFGWLTEKQPQLRVNEIAETFADRVVSMCRPGELVIWMAGFSPVSMVPEFCRITLRTTEDRRVGERHVDPVSDQEIVDGSGRKFVGRLVPDLYEAFCEAAAREQSMGEYTFGGHWHSLVLQPLKPAIWVRPPCIGKLGIDELLSGKNLGSADLEIASPELEIVSQMKRLKTELSLRTQRPNGKRAHTITNIMKYWERGTIQPDWEIVQRLVAMGDEATVAAPGNVSAGEAALYRAHVGDLIACLTEPTRLIRNAEEHDERRAGK